MTRKVVDCFNFCDELEVLNMRLHELNDVVDYFVLVESSITHSGTSKPLTYKSHKELFKKFRDKIVHVVVPADKMLHCGEGNRSNWRRSWLQRGYIREGTDQLSLTDNDIVLISDVDEVPNSERVKEYKLCGSPLSENRYAFLMRHFYYSFKWERLPTALTPNKGGEDCSWAAARLVPYHFYKDKDINEELRAGTSTLAGKGWRRQKYGIADGGWHCAYFGSARQVKKKFESWAHSAEYEGLVEEVGTLEYFQKRIDDGQFIFPREDGWETSEAEKLTEVDVENDDSLPTHKDLVNHELG